MGMTPIEFYEAFVCANYEDCVQHPGCVRRAFNAAVSASHLADHYWNYWERNDPSEIQDFKTRYEFMDDWSANTSGCFLDIRSIANAYKHLYTDKDQKKASRWSISSTGAIESISFNDESLEVNDMEETFIEEGKDDNSKYRVIYTCKDGQRKDFLASLEKVIDYWRKKYY